MQRLEEIIKAFNHSATTYEANAIAQNEIGDRLMDRLLYLKTPPKTILDLGCGTGRFSLELKKRYPKAQIISFDLAMNMLQVTKAHQGWFKKWPLVCGDMHQLPFADGAFDMVFSNQVIHWSEDLEHLVQEVLRVLKVDGCMMMSTLGPDTLKEIRSAFAEVDGYSHTNEFMDMHDIGDILLHNRVVDPVVDMEPLTVRYSSMKSLLKSLKAQGVRNVHAKRLQGMLGKQHLQAFMKAFENLHANDGKFPLTYEVVYLHGWRGVQRRQKGVEESVIAIDSIQKKKPG